MKLSSVDMLNTCICACNQIKYTLKGCVFGCTHTLSIHVKTRLSNAFGKCTPGKNAQTNISVQANGFFIFSTCRCPSDAISDWLTIARDNEHNMHKWGLNTYAKDTALPFQCHSRGSATTEYLIPWVNLNDDSLQAFTDRQLLFSALWEEICSITFVPAL